MSDRRYEVREVGACGCGRQTCPFDPILDSIPDALVEEAAKRLRAKSGIRLFDYETVDEIGRRC